MWFKFPTSNGGVAEGFVWSQHKSPVNTGWLRHTNVPQVVRDGLRGQVGLVCENDKEELIQ